MVDKAFNVFSINNVTPIRFDVPIAFPPRPKSYVEVTYECRRYEQNLCRACDNPRLRFCPWCAEHLPWDPDDLPGILEPEDTIVPKRIY